MNDRLDPAGPGVDAELDWLTLPVRVHANDGTSALNVTNVGEAQLGKRFV